MVLNFSRTFQGTIWSVLPVPAEEVLLIEVRQPATQRVLFSALKATTGEWLWHGVTLEETWWIRLAAATPDTVLFTLYADTNNPDRKALFAHALGDLQLRWWRNDFALSSVGSDSVLGLATKWGAREEQVDLYTGQVVNRDFVPLDLEAGIIRPHHYVEGTAYFETVQRFLQQRIKLTVSTALEYLEHNGMIFISYYQQQAEGLVNHLLILDESGTVLLQEKLDEPRKGIGLDTFFILQGSVIFVKNSVELVSYKIV